MLSVCQLCHVPKNRLVFERLMQCNAICLNVFRTSKAEIFREKYVSLCLDLYNYFLKVKKERQNIEKLFMDSIKSFGELM